MKLYKILSIIGIFIFFCECSNNSECITYECRRKNIIITLNPETIDLGETTTLAIERKKFYLPHFRVFIGDYDKDFRLQEGIEAQFFEGSDSLASIILAPESKGLKQIRGIIEEYAVVSQDSIDTYRYPFEMELQVR